MIEDSDLGGEPACWAHFVGDLDGGDPDVDSTVETVDLGTLVDRPVEGSSGAIWSLPHGGDLDANVVRLRPGDAIGEHVNDDVDVLVVVWSGAGELTADGRPVPLRPGTVCRIDRGARRRIRAGADGMTYLSVHRRREGLTITRR